LQSVFDHFLPSEFFNSHSDFAHLADFNHVAHQCHFHVVRFAVAWESLGGGLFRGRVPRLDESGIFVFFGVLAQRPVRAMSNLKKGCMQVKLNPDRILDLILETFVEYDNWLTFRQLANRLTGDPANDQLIAGIVYRHSRVLVVTDGCRCKLRTAFIEDAPIACRQQSSTHLV